MRLPIRFNDSRTLLRIGMACLAVALLAQRFMHPAAGLGEDAVDAIRGCLIGVSIGLNLWSVRLASRGRGRGCGAS